jgi:hypothetical protein
MGTNCVPLLADLFLYSYEFLKKLVKDKKIHEVKAFNFTYRYIGDVLSINNSRFAEFFQLIYSPELEIRVITKLSNSEQSYKGKVKTHNYINRQNQSTTGKL